MRSARTRERGVTRWWLNGGLGGVKMQSEDWGLIAASTSFNYQHGHHLFTARMLGASQWDASDEHIAGYSSISLLYGLATKSRWRLASLSLGLGRVVINHLRSYDPTGTFIIYQRPQKTIGVSFDAQLFIRGHSFLGLGFHIVGSVNSVRSVCGWIFELQIGDMK